MTLRDRNLVPTAVSAVSLASLAAMISMLPTLAHADQASEIDADLRAFGKNSAEAMKRLPPKTGTANAKKPAFTAEQIASGEFVTLKDSLRKQQCTRIGGARVCLSDVLPGRAPYQENDLAENLVDNADTMVRSLTKMDELALTTAKLAETPWSDSYWPIYQGQLSNRYADPEFPSNSDWNAYQTYAKDHDFLAMLTQGNSSAIDLLSPAEKYDLLVGDASGTLTRTNWAAGEEFFHDTGKVETWMGICHGWSPASYMVPRPKHVVELLAADGKTWINFYPSDIKALSSLLWAKGNVESRMIGGRCDDKRPRTDENGHIVSGECFDTNPGTWHMAVVNQIGVAKRSFVIDATYDYEVWNQPVYSYSYSYFNPKGLKRTTQLSEATVAVKDFDTDKFKRYRSPEAVTIVGIAMTLTYVQETNPSHVATDGPEDDSPATVRYMYDLELNANGEIVGGEWYVQAHPDFLWTPAADDRVVTVGDRRATGTWKITEALPESWRKAAAAASRAGTPLAKIVEALSQAAHTGLPPAPRPIVTPSPVPTASPEPTASPAPTVSPSPSPAPVISPSPSRN